jgi:predicted polyphosphate/ATP-dependent NAD kinase
MNSVGIIANPASGKDIRRLVAYGICFDNQEKVNIVKRCLLGLAAAGVERVLYMPDYYGIVRRAAEGLGSGRRLPLDIIELDMDMTATQADSSQAADKMYREGVGCLITLGGDGTNRMVAKTCADIPLVPISTGTNNVFPQMLEGTIAGLAAGMVARGLAAYPAVHPSKRLIISKNGTAVDMALIDAVVVKDVFIGSRAIWDEKRIRQVVLTRGEPDNIGISSIGGNLHPVGPEDEKGLLIDMGPGSTIAVVPIAPGLIRPVAIRDFRILDIGEQLTISDGPFVIALDGEREVEVGEGEQVTIRLAFDGPKVVDARLALRQAKARSYLQSEAAYKNLILLKEEN